MYLNAQRFVHLLTHFKTLHRKTHKRPKQLIPDILLKENDSLIKLYRLEFDIALVNCYMIYVIHLTLIHMMILMVRHLFGKDCFPRSLILITPYYETPYR